MIMWKKVFVLLLFISLAYLSFSTSLVFADSASDAKLFNNQGVEQLQLGNYEEANSYFDKALQIDPNNVTYLNNKGLATLGQANYYEALRIFYKVLEINPDDPIALDSYNVTQNGMYQHVNGVVDVIVEDSNGYLVGYYRTEEVSMILNEHTKSELDPYVSTEMKLGDKDTEVILFKTVFVAEKETTITKSGINSVELELPLTLVISKHIGTPIEKGDVITTYFRILKPIE